MTSCTDVEPCLNCSVQSGHCMNGRKSDIKEKRIAQLENAIREFLDANVKYSYQESEH